MQRFEANDVVESACIRKECGKLQSPASFNYSAPKVHTTPGPRDQNKSIASGPSAPPPFSQDCWVFLDLRSASACTDCGRRIGGLRFEGGRCCHWDWRRDFGRLRRMLTWGMTGRKRTGRTIVRIHK